MMLFLCVFCLIVVILVGKNFELFMRLVVEFVSGCY